MDERYSRQILLEQIQPEGQAKFSNAKVAIVGIGALGTVAAELLVRAGIQNLLLIDRDIIEISNLQRQTLFTQDDINKPKATTAKHHLLKIDPSINITTKQFI